MNTERSREMRKWSWLKFDRRLRPVEKQRYISERESRKCRRVAAVFKDMYRHENLLVLDAGVYGFIKLRDFSAPYGFDTVELFTDSRKLFEDLWKEWRNSQMISLMEGSPLEMLDYGDVYSRLPLPVRRKIRRIKRRMMQRAGVRPLHRCPPLGRGRRKSENRKQGFRRTPPEPLLPGGDWDCERQGCVLCTAARPWDERGGKSENRKQGFGRTLPEPLLPGGEWVVERQGCALCTAAALWDVAAEKVKNRKQGFGRTLPEPLLPGGDWDGRAPLGRWTSGGRPFSADRSGAETGQGGNALKRIRQRRGGRNGTQRK